MPKHRLRLRLLTLLAAAALAVVCFAPGSAGAKRAACTFQVLHNDRIGAVLLPAGTYNIRVGAASGLSCRAAGTLFARFLNDYDGIIPRPYRAVARGSGKASFRAKGTLAFSVSRQSGGGGGGGGGGNSRLGTLCPGNFLVQHNDAIGNLPFPRGAYNIYLPTGSRLRCNQASNLFSRFLAFPTGNLPNGWRVRRQIALFYRANNPTRQAFRIDPST